MKVRREEVRSLIFGFLSCLKSFMSFYMKIRQKKQPAIVIIKRNQQIIFSLYTVF